MMILRFKKILPFLSPFLLAMCSAVNTSDNQIPDEITLAVKVDGPSLKTDGTYGLGAGVKTHWAVWVANEQGEYIKTLKVNNSTPQINSYGSDKLTSLPLWYASSGFIAPDDTAGMLTEEKIYKEFDAVTAASLDLSSGEDSTVEVQWDGTDSFGEKIVDGVYRLYVELSALVKNIASIDEPSGNKVDAITSATVKDLWIDSIIVTDTTATVYTYTKDSYETHFIGYGLDSLNFTDTIPVPFFPRVSITELQNLIPDTTYYILFRGELLSDPEGENHAVMGSFRTSTDMEPDTTYDNGKYESQSSFVTIDFSSGEVIDGDTTENILEVTAELITK